MVVLSVARCPYKDYNNQIIHLNIKLDEGEKICLNEIILIEMMDGTFLEREVRLINPKYEGDYHVISNMAKKKVEEREYGMSCEEFLKLDLSVQTIRHNKKERLLKK